RRRGVRAGCGSSPEARASDPPRRKERFTAEAQRDRREDAERIAFYVLRLASSSVFFVTPRLCNKRPSLLLGPAVGARFVGLGLDGGFEGGAVRVAVAVAATIDRAVEDGDRGDAVRGGQVHQDHALRRPPLIGDAIHRG